MNIEFESDSVYGDNDKYIKTKIKLYECKYEITKNKMENFINDDLDTSSSDASDNESDNEFDN